MHPILFRIPLPKYPLPITWLLLAAAAIGLVFAVLAFVRQNRQGAVVPGAIAVACAGAGLYFRGRTWDMSPIPIYSYGVMLGLSLVVGWYLTLGLSERDGLPKETMANNYVVTAIAAVAGSRVLYILTNLNEFDSFEKLFAMRQGGLVAYGGFLGGLAGSFFFLRRHKIPLLPWADVAVPSLASGLMITRIGCYLFGCDFGKPLEKTAPTFLQKLGTFPHWAPGTLDNGDGAPAWAQHVKAKLISHDAPASLPVHPTQLYESLVGLGLLGLLLWSRRHQKFRGQIFFLFAFAYGVCRYGLEVIRDDAERGEIPPSLPEHFLIPLGAAILAAGFVIGFSKQIKNTVIQRAAQVLSFVPAVLLYIALRPTDGFDKHMQYSTSQFIAVTTGFAACVAFSVFYKAALAHPESAMALNLPPEADAASKPEEDDDDEDEDDDEDDEDDDEAPKAKPAAKKPAPKVASKAAPKKATPVAKDEHEHDDDDEDDDDDDDDDDDEEEEEPVAKKPAPKPTQAAPAKKRALKTKGDPKADKRLTPKVKKDEDDEES